MKAILALVLVLFSSQVAAQSRWDHNGSVVTLRADGAIRKFYYEQPRSGLPIKSGTLLFDGRKQGDRYSGTAYVFHSKCGARGYFVTGPIANDQRTVTLHGQVPRIDANCNIAGYREDTLVFSFRHADAVVSENAAPLVHAGPPAFESSKDFVPRR